MFNTKGNRLRHIVVLTYFLVSQLKFINSQTIINGSFENNNGIVGNDYLDLTNTQFNNLVDNCYSFGISSYSNIDLISRDVWDGLAQDGDWYVGLSGIDGDRVSLEITDSLEIGEEYKITFYDRSRENNGKTSVIIGVSEENNDFGIEVFQGGETNHNKWKLRYFTFIATIKAKYITVKADNTGWAKIDNFCLSKVDYCIDLPEIEMPNVFTPNNDGVNDLFKPVVFKGMESGNMIILNRWGNVIYESNDLSNGWDGTFQNKPVSDGVYFYKIHYKTIFENEEVKYGSFHLFR